MLFGIKYETNKKGLKIANMCLKRYDSALLTSGKNTGVLFSNPIVAIKVSRQLNEKIKFLTYKVYKLTKEEERKIDHSFVVSTMEEYENLVNGKASDAIKKVTSHSNNTSSNSKIEEKQL